MMLMRPKKPHKLKLANRPSLRLLKMLLGGKGDGKLKAKMSFRLASLILS
jgi:hypothetical protein